MKVNRKTRIVQGIVGVILVGLVTGVIGGMIHGLFWAFDILQIQHPIFSLGLMLGVVFAMYFLLEFLVRFAIGLIICAIVGHDQWDLNR